MYENVLKTIATLPRQTDNAADCANHAVDLAIQAIRDGIRIADGVTVLSANAEQPKPGAIAQESANTK